MRKLGVQTKKGGEGKSTMAGHIAFMLAEAGHKTIIVDTDPQGNQATWWLGTKEAKALKTDFYDVIANGASFEDAIYKVRENLYVLPVRPHNKGFRDFAKKDVGQKPMFMISVNRALEALGFDHAVYDCPPSESVLTDVTVLTLDEYIPVMKPEEFSIEGFAQAVEYCSEIQRNLRNDLQLPNIIVEKLIVNNIDQRRKDHMENVEAISQLEGIDRYYFGADSKISQCVAHKKSIFEFAIKSKSTDSSKRTIKELRRLYSALIGASE